MCFESEERTAFDIIYGGTAARTAVNSLPSRTFLFLPF